MSILVHEVHREATATASEEHAESLVKAAATAFSCGRPAEGRRLLREVSSFSSRDDLTATSRALLSAFAGHTCARRPAPAAHQAAATTLVAWGQPLAAFAVLLDAGRDATAREAARALAAAAPSQCGLAAVVALDEGDYSSALALLKETGRQAEDAGRHGVLTHVCTLVAELSVHLGRHGAAAMALTNAHQLSARTSQPIWAARAAMVEAARAVLCDNPDRDRLLLDARRTALAAAPELYDSAELLQAAALASDDRWTDAFDVLRRLALRGPRDAAPLLPAGLLSMLADAATHVGQQEDARTLISRIAVVDTHCERDIELAELLYATAVLSPGPTAETCYEVALSLDPHRLPWHRARTSLAYGGWLRRARRVAESRSHLLEALMIFEALDLPIWVRRTRAELRASGMRSAGVAGGELTGLDLSPQELEIGRLVARGLTNRQIGEAMHLSPRTIGSHLYRIFPKLDITSRNQLAALLQ